MTHDFSTPAFSAPGSTRKRTCAGTDASAKSLGLHPAAAIAYLGPGNSAAEEFRTVVRGTGERVWPSFMPCCLAWCWCCGPLLLGLSDPPVSIATSLVAVVLLGVAALGSSGGQPCRSPGSQESETR